MSLSVGVKEEFIPNDNKIEIYTCTWTVSLVFAHQLIPQPTEAPVKANVVFVHGHAEHITRYDGVFKQIAEQGIKIHGFDQVGCGKTGERANDLGGAMGLSRTILDITDAIDRVHDQDIPLFIMGHSFVSKPILFVLTNRVVRVV